MFISLFAFLVQIHCFVRKAKYHYTCYCSNTFNTWVLIVRFVRENSQVLFMSCDYIHCMQSQGVVSADNNKSTAGADASVEALKLYHMVTLAYLALLRRSSSRSLHGAKSGK